VGALEVLLEAGYPDLSCRRHGDMAFSSPCQRPCRASLSWLRVLENTLVLHPPSLSRLLPPNPEQFMKMEIEGSKQVLSCLLVTPPSDLHEGPGLDLLPPPCSAPPASLKGCLGFPWAFAPTTPPHSTAPTSCPL
jgi:hypothetical protein